MKVSISPAELRGTVSAPSSKSYAHRLLICAAMGESETIIKCDTMSKDIEATIACLCALGAEIEVSEPGALAVKPIDMRKAPVGVRTLRCGESGSTLRFMLPVVGALGADAEFIMEGRLPERPLAPFDDELRRHGMSIVKEGCVLRCSGKLNAGDYTLPGDVSSQYISGLLMALPMVDGDSSLTITGKTESSAYIDMTVHAITMAGGRIAKTGRGYDIPGFQRYGTGGSARVEGDWSGAAFFLCAGALSREGVTVTGLNVDSAQGDKAVLHCLRQFGAVVETVGDSVTVRRGELRGITIDAAPIPDLIPVLCAVAANAEGETRVINGARLRLKESDRIATTADYLRRLGADAAELDDGLVIRGRKLTGGDVWAHGDHRIAMAAAVAACGCSGTVTVDGAESVKKSYPQFWEDYATAAPEGCLGVDPN